MSGSSPNRFEKFVAWSQAARSAPERPAKPFEKLWLVGNIVYLGAIIVLYAYSSAAWDPNVPGGPLRFAALALFICSIGSYSIYTGEVSFKGYVCVRSMSPVAFWACVAVEFLIGISVFLVGISAIRL